MPPPALTLFSVCSVHIWLIGQIRTSSHLEQRVVLLERKTFCRFEPGWRHDGQQQQQQQQQQQMVVDTRAEQNCHGADSCYVWVEFPT